MRKKFYLTLLLMMFPIAVIYFNHSHPFEPIHHGTVLQPVLNMKNFNMFTTDDHKWQIAYVPSVCCDSVCGKELSQLTELQKTLEKKGKSIDLKLIATQFCEVHDSHHIFLEAINKQQVKQFQATFTQSGEKTFDMTGKIYIIDPQQNLFVYYASPIKPADILNDLRRVIDKFQQG